MNANLNKKTILVAPLNWGLGHATRCIPIIKALQENNFTPIIASDGIALDLLRKEFPNLQTLALPSYHIEYPKNSAFFKWKLMKNLPRMFVAIQAEKRMVKNWIKKYHIDGILCDNRLGVYNKKITSVYMTHQLNVLTGSTTWISTAMHHHIIKKHSACWIPDFKDKPNLTGKLGHSDRASLPLEYIGPLSRLHKKESPVLYDLLIILSGPEPQRGLLEAHLQKEVLRYKGKVIFIKGIVEVEQKKEQIDHVTFYNFMKTQQLEQVFNESNTVLCRSGYTTIMDLAKLNKKAFFIPTPGQYEQMYLAEKLQKERIAPYTTQSNFRIEDLSKIDNFDGFPQVNDEVKWKKLFEIFNS